jgi:AraC-like DNA-binding protein
MTPISYLTMLRIDKAASRLAKTRQPISRIARQCGYSSVPSFTRAFAKALGTTPSQFRNQAQSGRAE